MRFHIGFSKFIKPGQLLKWLGIGFVGVLAYLGFTDHAFAQTLYDGTNTDLHTYISTYEMNIYQKQRGSIATTSKTFSWSYDRNSGSYLTTFYDNAWLIPGGTYDYRTYFTNYNWTLSTNMCSSVSGSKSMDFYFYVNTYSSTQWNTMFANNGLFPGPYTATDIASFYIEPVYSGGGDGPPVQYACNIENVTGNDYRYRVLCSGVPVENILGYKIYYFNNFWYEYQNQPNSLYGGTNAGDQPLFVRVVDGTVDYYCSDVSPIGPDEPLLPDDAIGSSNLIINQDESGNGTSSTVTSDTLYLDWYNELDIPQSVTNLLMVPFNLVSLVTNDMGGTCQPISINLSSITRRWGNFDYSVTVPCMRSTLNTLLGVNIVGNFTLYGLADAFTAFFLTLWLAQKFWFAIQEMLAGRDVHKYLIIG